MKIYGNMNFSVLKIIIIILGYTPNNMIVDDGKIYNFKVKERIHFLKKKILFLSMWKLTLDYDNHVSLGTRIHLSQEIMILEENGMSPSLW
jgi:hypothetical protein